MLENKNAHSPTPDKCNPPTYPAVILAMPTQMQACPPYSALLSPTHQGENSLPSRAVSFRAQRDSITARIAETAGGGTALGCCVAQTEAFAFSARLTPIWF